MSIAELILNSCKLLIPKLSGSLILVRTNGFLAISR